jgi:hypothetical protein
MEPGDEAKLHKKKMQFTYSEDDKLTSADGAGVLQAIRDQVGIQEDYVERKQELLRTVGYEDGRWALNVVAPAPPNGVHPHEQVVDFTLGLRPSIEATSVEVRDVRFGIASPEPTDVLPPGTILEARDRRPVAEGTVTLTAEDGRRHLRLLTKVFVPQGIGFEIEPQHLKIRFAAPFVNFVFWPSQEGRLELKYDLPDPNEEYDLKELQPVSELIMLLHEASVQESQIDFDIEVDSRLYGSGHIDVQGTQRKEVIDYATAVVHSWIISKQFDVQDVVRLRPIELEGQKLRLMVIAEILGPSRPRFRVMFHPSEGSPPAGEKELWVPFGTNAFIGQYLVSVAWAIVGQPQKIRKTGDETELLIETSEVRLYRDYLCGRDEVPKYTLRDLMQSVVRDSEGSAILIAEGVNSHFFE